MKGSYDDVAPFYDRLSKFVFGSAVLRAHQYLINAIPADSAVLIIGGGSGFILEEIAKKCDGGLQITYVDNSKKMIDLSAKRNAGNNRVTYINQSVSNIDFPQKFDVVITPFFLDNFSEKSIKIIYNKIDSFLKPQGLWLFADFQLDKNVFWQKLMLQIMYLFFRIFCNIEASQLPDFGFHFRQYNYQLILKKTFYRNFIQAEIYRKN